MVATACNSLNISQEGMVYFDGISVFSGIDGDTINYVLTSNGPGVAPSFQASGSQEIDLNGDVGTLAMFLGNGYSLNAGLSSLRCGLTVGFTAIAATSMNLNVTDANDNTLIGLSSGLAGASGVENTALGYLSASSLTDGSLNTAIGARALASCAHASHNTAIGDGALNACNVDGNTAIGYHALVLATHGFNASLGYLSLSACTTGEQNTSVGHGSGVGVTTGSANTSIGYSTLTGACGSNNTCVGNTSLVINTGSNNTAIGVGSLGHYLGDNNTAVGYLACRDTTGVGNTAVGHISLVINTSGIDNTAVGFQSLSNLLTGNSNTVLGYNSGSSYTGSESGNLLINNVGVIGDSNITRIGTSQTDFYPIGILHTNSGRTVNLTTPGAYPYTTLTTDDVILVDSSSSRTIVPLGSPINGTRYIIKDNVGSAGTNNITVTPSGKNIDGQASFIINTNYGSITIVYNGSEWSVI